ncbi:alkaline phosphatase-like [Mizuhopecten yessoensis]|uniref:alkaline phosphatase n=1 Tax=Mizuhopecten yessoensis TaxID=6573 RepID=A0A210Q0E6_MIZYE|nr:alkaline phosphatase-like [Mizuhopecten yessoensis]OWF42220.1 Alkaline phosphatase, tissue-nonspecific isozyme [Mizuhopecten yessoensis]
MTLLRTTCLLLTIVACLHGLPNRSTDWNKMARDSLDEALKLKQINKVAKNVILFIGDGLGLSTVTASRILKGQKMGNPGEETVLEFEKFPYVALSKVYGSDKMVPDSAATASALMCGEKTNWYLVGTRDPVSISDCVASKAENMKMTCILDHFIADGRSTGVVTSARVTHATPASAYAHTPNRDWEGDVQTVGIPGDCKDIAYQLIYDNNNINVVLGGGRRSFLPNTTVDPETGTVDKRQRQDGHDLIQIWKDIQRTKGRKYDYVWNKGQFDNINPSDVDYLLGLFGSSHMQYVLDRDPSDAGEPTLAELTEKAINILKKNTKGYFLMVEGARIDHAHHDTLARYALEESLALEAALKQAADMTSEEDTLIIFTADHSHVFNIGGYTQRGDPIFGISHPQSDEPPLDGLPYTILNYGNGPNRALNGSRVNLTGVDTGARHYIPESAIPLAYETHSAEDVGIYARGPMAHLLHGVKEQHYVAHMMQYAACVGDFRNCVRDDVNNGRQLMPSLWVIFFTMCLKYLTNV